MNQELLYNFFEGKTLIEEEKNIRDWMEESDTNLKCFMQSRKEFDIQTLSGSEAKKRDKKKYNLKSLSWIPSVAAVIIALIIGGIYLFNLSDKTEQFNTIIVPAGQRINLILSDNTNLWLNANTQFRYPTEFSKDIRTVYLDGEAYFEVSKNEKKPFIVKTYQGEIHVTGTSFNVEAYSKYNSFETSLFEGGVDIYKENSKLASLKPNEIGTLKNNELLITDIIDKDNYLWREGLIAFNNKKLEEVLIDLEKYFNVDIHISTSCLPKHTYTGKFRQSDGVIYALRVLQRSINFKYIRDEETGVIYID